MTTISSNITLTQSYINGVTAWPITISGGTLASPIVVRFGERLTLTSATTRYFNIGSQYVTIDGSYNTVVISSIPSYLGLVRNGIPKSTSGFSNVTIQNIDISCIGTTSVFASYSGNDGSVAGGFLCQAGFARLASNNIVQNCSCITNSSSASSYAGILIGANASQSGNLIVRNCYAVGNAGNDGGIICGGFAASGAGSRLEIINCYSIGGGASYGGGGIVGPFAASSSATTSRIIVRNCYNPNGSFGGDNGGIFGYGASGFGTKGYIDISNCYAGASSQIFANGADTNYITQTKCYAAGGSWSDTTATSSLVSNSGIWVDISLSATNVPWRLSSAMPNVSLYVPNSISSRTTSITTSAGVLSSPYTYSVIAVNGISTLPAGFSINSSTGVITCSSESSFTYDVRVIAQLNANYGYAIGNILITASPSDKPVVTCMCPDFSNNRIFVATRGTTAGTTSTTINGLGVLNLSTNTWSSINLNTSLAGNVYTMSLYNNTLFVGGSFYNVNNNSQLNYTFKYNITANTIVPVSSTTLGNASSANNSTEMHGPSSSIITETGNVYCHGRFGTTGAAVSSGASLFPYYDFSSQILYKQYASVTTPNPGNGIQTFCQINDTDLYVGGNFTNLGGASVSYFAKANTSTKAFSSVGTVNNSVSLSIYNPTNTTIYLFGAFTSINGSAVSYMSGYNTTTQTFVSITGLSSSDSVSEVAIDISNQKLYMVGSFTTAGGLTLNATGFAIYNISSNTWTAPSTLPHTPTTISMLDCAFNTTNGLVYLIPATSKNALYSYNPSSDTYVTITGANALATSAISNLSYNCMVYSSYNNYLYIGGVFDTCTGGGSSVSCNNILAYDVTNNTFSALDVSGSVNGFTNGVQCMYFNPADNFLYVGGGFNWVAGQKITNYAKYNLSNQTWSSIWPSKYSLVPADEQTIASGGYVSGTGKVRPGYRMHIYNNGVSNQTMYMSTYTFDTSSSVNLNTFARIQF